MSVLQELRGMGPSRTLTLSEARFVAERQAHRLRLRLALQHTPLLPSEAIESLPRLRVRSVDGLSSSGLSGWHIPSRTWQVYLNADDDARRQRFTLLHEYKHIIDRPFDGQLVSFGAFPSSDQVEMLCDHFASCALMPRPQVKWEWINGNQTVQGLAMVFGVTPAAMRVRLSKLGLNAAEPSRRHSPMTRSDDLLALGGVSLT